MATLVQVYDPPGAPYRIMSSPSEVVAAWRSHRQRLRERLAAFGPSDWAGPTRCTDWNAAQLAVHLAGVTGFVGATLSAARQGEATRFLDGFDPARDPKIIVGDGAPADPLADLAAADDRLTALLDSFTDDDWAAGAEAPVGLVPATAALAHVLFDSWVHERDFMVPRDEPTGATDEEATVVVAYIAALCGLGLLHEGDTDRAVLLTLSDPALDLVVEAEDGVARVRTGTEPAAAGTVVRVKGSVTDVCDQATGRVAGALGGDPEGLDALDVLNRMMN